MPAGPSSAPRTSAATQVWLWGQGHQPQLPSFAEATGRPRCAGHGRRSHPRPRACSPAWRSSRCPAPPAGSTPTTRASGTRRCARWPRGLTCSCSTSRPPTRRATPATWRRRWRPWRQWDSRILSGLVEGLDDLGPWRMLLLPDHPTPVALRTHTSESVPVPAGGQRPRRARRHLQRARDRCLRADPRPRDAAPPDFSLRAGAGARAAVFRSSGCRATVRVFCRGVPLHQSG